MDESTRTVLVFVTALAILELGREMRECGPSLKECREAGRDSATFQHLIDGQGHAGIIVAGAALVAWWASKDVVPALIIVGTYAALVWYQHSLVKAPATAGN